MLACIAFGIVWFVIDGFILPPNFGGTDIYFFKDAGINLAENLGFVSRFTFGNPTFEYHSYSQYPPVYPLLFGLFVKVFGTSALTNQLFNSAIGVLTGIAGFLVFKPLFRGNTSRHTPYILFAILAVGIVVGLFNPEADRPDGLAVSIGLVSIILATESRAALGHFIAGCACAIALFTSPFVGIWTSVAVGVVTISNALSSRQSTRPALRVLSVACGALFTLIVAVILIAVLLPDWFIAFAGVFTGVKTHNETGGGYFVALLRGDVRTWFSGIPVANPEVRVTAAKLVIVQVSLIAAVLCDCRSGPSFQRWGIVALLVVSPLCVILTPYQIHYVAITSALLLAGAACLTATIVGASRKIYVRAILTGLFFLYVLCGPECIRQFIVRTGTSASMMRARSFIDKDGINYVSEHSYLAVAPQVYMLWRERRVRPLTTAYSGFDFPENRVLLERVALAYSGSSNLMVPQRPTWLSEKEYALEYQPTLPQLATFFGIWTSHSSQTWESAIYRRKGEPN